MDSRRKVELFEEIRRYFPITQQALVYVAVDEVISRVVEAAEAELQRRSDLLGRCRALTRKGQPCQRGCRFITKSSTTGFCKIYADNITKTAIQTDLRFR